MGCKGTRCNWLKALVRWFYRWAAPSGAILIRVVGVAAIVYGACALLGGATQSSPLAGHEVDVLLVTFGVLVLYTYYTYKTANAPYEPVASFGLPSKTDGGRVGFILWNRCKRALDCWCRLDICCIGVEVTPPRFYSQEVPWYLPPQHEEHGGFSLPEALESRGVKWGKLAERERQSGRPQIHMRIKFGYGYPGRRIIWLKPIYYYRMSDHRVILDVAGVERTTCGLEL